MQLADAGLCHCPARASQEIKLDMRVDYIAFMKPWIKKLKDSTQRDPILVNGVSTSHNKAGRIKEDMYHI